MLFYYIFRNTFSKRALWESYYSNCLSNLVDSSGREKYILALVILKIQYKKVWEKPKKDSRILECKSEFLEIL